MVKVLLKTMWALFETAFEEFLDPFEARMSQGKCIGRFQASSISG